MLQVQNLFRSGASRFSFCKPATAEFFGGNAGKIRFEIEDGSAIQHVYATNVEIGFVSMKNLDRRQADWIRAARRTRREDAMRAAIVCGRMCDEIEIGGAIELPENEQMGKAFDVSQAGFELGKKSQNSFGIVPGVKAFGDLLGVGEGADDVTDARTNGRDVGVVGDVV